MSDICYARKLANGRLSAISDYDFMPRFHENRLQDKDLKSKKQKKIFVGSMGDMWGSWVDCEYIHQIIDIAANNPQHIFQFLTKNP